MPPERVSTPLFANCVFAIAGTFPGWSQTKINSTVTNSDSGATTSPSITKKVTHLITNKAEIDKLRPSKKRNASDPVDEDEKVDKKIKVLKGKVAKAGNTSVRISQPTTVGLLYCTLGKSAEKAYNHHPRRRRKTSKSKSKGKGKKSEGSNESKEEQTIPDSKLHPNVQELVALIFNTGMTSGQLKELDYDADKLPLDKLAKSTILRGYAVLKRISEVIDGKPDMTLLSDLSSEFYAVVPHNFGRNVPPVIKDAPTL
ncbi:Poly [ADP-ribose] polymerase 2 [Modicella reniformis]|uniref:NAD(+) ADP-ribosyltransferase n=1 Tax=Modicella reniformis TaxID=1440133 RepID=A0A9P6J595_9FUNG|nr:Poly [ADP-ribose] polymerase 2 [Modicella reniformis]